MYIYIAMLHIKVIKLSLSLILEEYIYNLFIIIYKVIDPTTKSF